MTVSAKCLCSTVLHLVLLSMAVLLTGHVAAQTTTTTESQGGLQSCCEEISDDAICNNTCIQTLSSLSSSSYVLTSTQIQALSSACSPSYTTFWSCMEDRISTPLPPYYFCCEKSENETCQRSCQQFLARPEFWTVFYNDLITACGPPPEDDVWTCLLGSEEPQTTLAPDPNAIPEQPLYADWSRIQCCYKAVAEECRTSCLDLYSSQISSESFSTFQLDCIHRPSEIQLSTCLLDVGTPCKLGCSGLQFCDIFNNRPTMSFRLCTTSADRMAKTSYYNWIQSGYIPHPLVPLFVDDVDRCLANMWKAVACVTHVQPCHATTHATQICRKDCMKLLSDCSSSDLAPEAICDIIAPPNTEEYCVSLEQFLEPSEYNALDVQRVTNPCTPNPCAEGYFCAVNHRCQQVDMLACTPFTCQPGCVVGDRPSFVVSEGGGVRVSLVTDLDRSCYGYFNCSENNADFSEDGGPALGGTEVTPGYRPVHLHCEMERQCVVGNITYRHQTTFEDGCNFCTCYHGRVTCTQKPCSIVNGHLKYASCICAMFHSPVCTHDGRTIPNSCIARCLGYTDDDFEQGDCESLDACGGSSFAACESGSKCLPHRHVCISPDQEVGQCNQHTCVSASGCVSNEPICDSNGVQHLSLCSFLTTQGEIDYFGYCKDDCSQDNLERVCGVNGETYDSRCHAENAYVAVDYMGPCGDIPGTNTDNPSIKGNCLDVVCPQLPPDCAGVVSHDSCCPQCGSHMTLLSDKEMLKRNIQALGRSYLSSVDMLRKLRYHISSLECDLFGHISYDGSVSVWILPTQQSPDNLMVKACNAEAVKLATFINNQTPMLASDPILSHLVAAQVQTTTFLSVPETTTPGPGASDGGVDGAELMVPSITLTVLLLVLALLGF